MTNNGVPFVTLEGGGVNSQSNIYSPSGNAMIHNYTISNSVMSDVTSNLQCV